jgi:hypothetical protein
MVMMLMNTAELQAIYGMHLSIPYNRSRKHRVNIKWLNAIWIADRLPLFVGIASSQLANN